MYPRPDASWVHPYSWHAKSDRRDCEDVPIGRALGTSLQSACYIGREKTVGTVSMYPSDARWVHLYSQHSRRRAQPLTGRPMYVAQSPIRRSTTPGPTCSQLSGQT